MKKDTLIKEEITNQEEVNSYLQNLNKENQLKNRLIELNKKRQILQKQINEIDRKITESFNALKEIRGESNLAQEL
ncbi:MAG: hypothetical protein K2P17_01485 [Helicobacteraceae bacterium]|nr:hypothetical protein [Helicobacteraceae bacterium]